MQTQLPAWAAELAGRADAAGVSRGRAGHTVCRRGTFRTYRGVSEWDWQSASVVGDKTAAAECGLWLT